MKKELLIQGSNITQNGIKSRRWIAVILDEAEVTEAIKDYNDNNNTEYTIEDLDISSLVDDYTNALLNDGQWYEQLKEAVAWRLEREAESKGVKR